MRRLWLTLWVLTAGGLAYGDVVHLKNGSKLEGEIVSRTKDWVTIKVEHGGKMKLPSDRIARVLSAEHAAARYGDRAADANMNDPADIEQLALWCSERGMGDKARELTTMARGLRLEGMIRRASRATSPKPWVDIFHWARANSLADEILLWILDQGRKLDPDDGALRLAYERFRKDLAERRRKLDFIEELRRRPRYAMPSRQNLPKASLGSVTASALAKKRSQLRSKSTAGATKAFIDEARAAHLEEVERRAGVVKERDAWRRHWQETYDRRREEEEERAARAEAARWEEARKQAAD